MLHPEVQFQEYEYSLHEVSWDVNDFHQINKKEHAKLLDKMAKRRWELIDIVQNKRSNGNIGSIVYYFRRMKIMDVSIGSDK